jgi:hypothetical protein
MREVLPRNQKITLITSHLHRTQLGHKKKASSSDHLRPLRLGVFPWQLAGYIIGLPKGSTTFSRLKKALGGLNKSNKKTYKENARLPDFRIHRADAISDWQRGPRTCFHVMGCC